MFFTRQNLPLPCRPFPFDPPAQVLPILNTRLPLSPYCNPLPAQLRQPRYFLLQNDPILSLFCKDGFQKQYRQSLGRATRRLNIFPRILTQGRLHCTQHTILCTALQVHTWLVREEASNWSSQLRRTIPGLRGNRVVCTMPLVRARNP